MSKTELIQDLFDSMAGLRRSMHGGYEQFLSVYNLTRPQLGMLFLLLHEAKLSVSQIASQTGVTNGAATQTLDVMVRRGLVERHVDEVDRRVSRLSLTSNGRDLAGTIKARQMEEMTALFSTLEETELQALVTAVAKLKTLINQNHHGHTKVG